MIDLTKINLDEMVAAIDQQRQILGLSYQAFADACDVSQSTMIRVLKRKTPPSIDLLNRMAAAAQYAPELAAELILPNGYTPDDYVDYVKRLMVSQQVKYEQRLQEQTALYNRLRRQDRRTIFWLGLCLALLIAAFIIWLIIDVTHPTVGWFQREVAARGGSILGDLFGSSGTAFL